MTCIKPFIVELRETVSGDLVSTRTISVQIVEQITLASTASFNVNEGSTAVGQIAFTGGSAPTFALSGADAALFSISSTGVLSFDAAPDFEAPADANTDNDYVCVVTVSDPVVASQAQNVTVTVQSVNETITGSMVLQETGADVFAINADVIPPSVIAGTMTIQETGADVIDIAVIVVPAFALYDTDASANTVEEGAATDTYTGLTVGTNLTSPTFVIITQEELGAFKINSTTGVVSVDDGTRIVYAA